MLLTEKVAVLAKYSNFIDVFLKNLAAELSKHSDINKYSIELKPGKQPSSRPIYSLGPVELEIFKTYININLANDFICPSKFSALALILFIQKPDSSFRLIIDYQSLNNLIIEN